MSIPPPRNTSSRTATQMMYAPPMMTASQFNDLYSARTRAIIERSKQPVYTASGYNYYDQPATSAPYASYYYNNNSQRATTSAAYPSPVFPRSMPTTPTTTAAAYGYMSRY